MLNIKIGEYIITSDDMQFIIKKERKVEKVDSERFGEIDLITEGYYGTLEGLMSGLLKKMIVTTTLDIKTLEGLSKLVKGYSEMIRKELGGITC